MTKLNSAIDFSTGELLLSVVDGCGNRVFESSIEMRGRDSSGMVSWIRDIFEENNCSLSDVEKWTCGMGPGSFTGLRIVAAVVSGLTFNSSVRLRGVPSAVAIASEVSKEYPSAKHIGILYDGRRGECLCYGIRSSESGFSVPETIELPAITRDDDSILSDFDILVAMKTEKNALDKVMSESALDKVVFLDSFPVKRLIEVENFPWDRKTILNPVYLRPSVHVKPSTIRRDV